MKSRIAALALAAVVAPVFATGTASLLGGTGSYSAQLDTQDQLTLTLSQSVTNGRRQHQSDDPVRTRLLADRR